MRRAATWMLATIVIVFAGDRAGDGMLNAILIRSQFRFSRVYRGDARASIVIVGDSRGVNCCYAPRIEQLTGQRTLNLSYNALSSRIAEAVLRDYLDRNQPPRVVLLEVTNIVAPMELVPEVRTYANISPRLRALYAEQHPLAAKAGQVFRLLAYNSELFLRVLYYLHRSDQDWIARTNIPPGLLAAPRIPVRLRIDPANLDAFERTVRLLRERGIQVRLIYSPDEDPARIVNVDEFIRAVEERTRRVDPTMRVRSYIAAGGPPENFADRVHLNERGATLFVERLQRDGVFIP